MHYLDYNEQKQHGTPDFPIEFYHVDHQHPRYSMPFHWHMELEIIRILKGQMKMHLDDDEFIAFEGEIIFINEGVIHGGHPEDCIYECIVFNPHPLLMHTETCRQYIRQIFESQIMIHNHFLESDNSIQEAANSLFRAMQENAPGSELMIIGSLYQLFGVIFQYKLYGKPDLAPSRSLRKMVMLKPVLEYVDACYASQITLEDLSKTAGMSPKYFCRYFHSVTHRTPMDYLNYYRIERACYEFSTTDLSVTEVAYRCGFNDTSYFIKSFKRYKGITPKQYSKQQLNPSASV